MTAKNNILGWFEIPVTNMERAMKFYEAMMDITLSRNQKGALDMAWFPWFEEGRGSASSLVCNPEYYKPSRDDVLIYMTAQAEDMNAELNRVEEVGEKIIQHKTLIAEGYGFMAIFIDTEGNRIALHSRK